MLLIERIKCIKMQKSKCVALLVGQTGKKYEHIGQRVEWV